MMPHKQSVLLAAAVLSAMVVAGGCTSKTFNVSYVRAVQELVLAYPRFDGTAPAGEYGFMTDHPAYDSFYDRGLNVRHVVVVPGQECRAEIVNRSALLQRTTYVTVRRLDMDRTELVTYSEVDGKGMLTTSRDLTWETRQISEFGGRLQRMEMPQ